MWRLQCFLRRSHPTLDNILGRSLVLLGTIFLMLILALASPASPGQSSPVHTLQIRRPAHPVSCLPQCLAEGNIEILNLDMKPGNILKVKGKISPDADGFSINLGCSSKDLAFHFNPRFNESVIVFNSKCSDAWETEDRHSHLSFFRDCTVKFFIEMMADKFRVKLPDGHEVCFPNRHKYRKVNFMSILGGFKMISFKLS